MAHLQSFRSLVTPNGTWLQMKTFETDGTEMTKTGITYKSTEMKVGFGKGLFSTFSIINQKVEWLNLLNINSFSNNRNRSRKWMSEAHTCLMILRKSQCCMKKAPFSPEKWISYIIICQMLKSWKNTVYTFTENCYFLG